MRDWCFVWIFLSGVFGFWDLVFDFVLISLVGFDSLDISGCF